MFQVEQEGQRWVNGEEKWQEESQRCDNGVGGNRVETFGIYGKNFGLYYESAGKLLEGLQ